jgi:putative addiction module killer protein
VYTVELTDEFREWLRSLRDHHGKAKIVSRLRLVGAGSLGDWKPIEGVVSEMRVDSGPGYRLYFARRGRIVILMLAGGDKSSQRSDIDRAIRIAIELEVQS